MSNALGSLHSLIEAWQLTCMGNPGTLRAKDLCTDSIHVVLCVDVAA